MTARPELQVVAEVVRHSGRIRTVQLGSRSLPSYPEKSLDVVARLPASLTRRHASVETAGSHKVRWNSILAAFEQMNDEELGRFVEALRQKGYIRRGR